MNSEAVCLQDILQNLKYGFPIHFLLALINLNSMEGAPLHLKKKRKEGDQFCCGLEEYLCPLKNIVFWVQYLENNILWVKFEHLIWN